MQILRSKETVFSPSYYDAWVRWPIGQNHIVVQSFKEGVLSCSEFFFMHLTWVQRQHMLVPVLTVLRVWMYLFLIRARVEGL
jgi:hypothetical protein